MPNATCLGNVRESGVSNNLTGFIVSVTTKGDQVVNFSCGNDQRCLSADANFIGYFWQMTERHNDGSFSIAHIREVVMIDAARKKYQFGDDVIFSVDEIMITPRALRGEVERVPPGYEGLERWYLAD